MKKVIALILACSVLTGCASNKVICNNEFSTYGFFNSDKYKNPNVVYEVSIGNIVWSVILFQTVIAPIYFIGFDIMQPVGLKENSNKIGVTNRINENEQTCKVFE